MEDKEVKEGFRAWTEYSIRVNGAVDRLCEARQEGGFDATESAVEEFIAEVTEAKAEWGKVLNA